MGVLDRLGVSRSGFHAWLNRPRSLRALAEEKLVPQVRSSFLASRRTYGERRVWHDVLAAGLGCGLHKIERLMREQVLRARLRRRGLPKEQGERYSVPMPPNIVSIRRVPPTASRLNLSCVRTGALVSAVKDGGIDGDHHWG